MGKETDDNGGWDSHLPSAREMYPEVFCPLDGMLGVLDDWFRGTYELPFDELVLIKSAFANRANNALRCINAVLENGHWIDAAILTRSLFELLLNLEEILKDPEDRIRRARRYVLFGFLQDYLKAQAINELAKAGGTLGGHSKFTEVLEELKANVPVIFAEFLEKKGTKANISHRWASSWCNKTVKKMANTSANPKRARQYQIMYCYASSLVHGSPATLSCTNAFGIAAGMNQQQTLAIERVTIMEYVYFAVHFCWDILSLSQDALPMFTEDAFIPIKKMLRDMFVAHSPELGGSRN